MKLLGAIFLTVNNHLALISWRHFIYFLICFMLFTIEYSVRINHGLSHVIMSKQLFTNEF